MAELLDELGFENSEDSSQEEFEGLRREAVSLGIHYLGNDIAELEALLTLARTERGVDHPVACYGVSYEPTDRRCRICQLRGPCAEVDDRPRVEVLDPNSLDDVVCEACGSGELRVELRQKDSETVRDYGCTTPGCLNTLGIQCGWSEADKPSPPIGFAPKPRVKVEGVLQEERLISGPDVEDAIRKKREKVVNASPPEDASVASDLEIVFPKKRIAPQAKRIVVRAVTEKSSVQRSAGASSEAAIPSKKVRAKPRKKSPPRKPAGVRPLRFLYEGEVYRNLTAVATAITGTRNWSGHKFFGCDPASLADGDELVRKWGDQTIRVKVEEEDE